MKILFIRHAKALEKTEWNREDLLRPLSQTGIKKAKRFFSHLPSIYHIEALISSKAQRAIQTAQILQELYPNARYFETARLNPGATSLDIERLIEKFRSYETIALIGHEPDFSHAIGHLCGCEELAIRIRKASVVEVEEDEIFRLCGMIYPKMFRGCDG